MVRSLSETQPTLWRRLQDLAESVLSLRKRVDEVEESVPDLVWGNVAGTLSNQTDLATALSGKATLVHTHAASDIVSGTIAAARLGSGTADDTTYLRGDGTWQTVSASASVDWGDIGGALSAQTDLNTALNGKQPLATVLTNTTASFTSAQETKLAGIATGATANSPDATLLDRANHTGTQAIATVTGLQTALDGKQAAGSYQPLATVLTNTTAAFTTAQETKLAGIATGATANSSDATLLSRVNHTGTQALTTVTLANTSRIAGRVTAGGGAAEELTAAQVRTLINVADGATANVGTVTSVGGTGTVSGLTLTGSVTVSGNLTLGGTLSVVASNFSSQTANTFLAAPNGSSGVPTFRAIAAADIPTLNQSTTGSAATLTTGRTIGMTGDVTWTSASFNGSGNVTGTSTIGNNVVSLAKMATVSTGTFLGRVTAATGNVEALTGTQATTLLDVFTTSLKGVVPASGGGTTNFLRADGTWAAPSGGGGGSPGGSTTQIQYNDAGAFAGSADLTWDNTGKVLGLNGVDTGIDLTAITNEPAAPASGKIHVYGKAIAGRMMLKVKGPSGLDTPLQPALFQNRIMMYVPSTGTTGTGSGTGIGPVWTSGGTVTHPTPSTTAPAISNQMNRTRYANVVTTTNQTLGIKAAAADSLKYWRGSAAGLGGFQYAARFIVELYPASTVRIFAGLAASSATYVVASDTVLNNTCGLWHDTTDPSTGAGAFNFVTRNATTTTKQQITLANAIAAGNSYDFYMWCAPNGSEIFWRLDDVVNNVTYEGSTSTTLPVNTAFMGPQCAMSNGTANITVTTSAIGIAGVYAESDR